MHAHEAALLCALVWYGALIVGVKVGDGRKSMEMACTAPHRRCKAASSADKATYTAYTCIAGHTKGQHAMAIPKWWRH